MPLPFSLLNSRSREFRFSVGREFFPVAHRKVSGNLLIHMADISGSRAQKQ
jgi:hypothetical protein